MTAASGDRARPLVASWTVAAAAGAGVVALALFSHRYPPAMPVLPDLSAPDFDKLVSAGRTLLALIAINLAALALATPFRSLVRDGEGRTSVVLRLTFGLFALAHAVLLLGFLHWISSRSLVLLVALSGSIGLAMTLVGVRRWATAGSRPRVRRRLPLAPVVIALALLLPLVSVFVPIYGWDALTYHLALPERFLRQGSLEVSPLSMFTTIPLLVEMLYTLALALDGPALAKLLHLEFAALLLVALSCIGARQGRYAALFAPLCLLACPMFMWETGVVYTDLPLALVSLLAIDAAMTWDRSADRSVVVRAALLCGLCASIRYQGAAVALALGAAVLVGGRQPIRRRVAFAAALGTGVLVFLAPWLLRNFAGLGTLLAHTVFDDVILRQMAAYHRSIGMGHGFFDLLAAPWNLTFRATPDVYVGGFGFQIGPLYLVAAAFALAAGLRRPESALPLRAAAVLFVAWFLSSQEARFLFPTLVAVSLAGSVGFESLVASARPALRVILLAIPAAAAIPTQIAFWNGSGLSYRVAFGDVPRAEIVLAEPLERIGEVLRADPRPDLRVLPLFESRLWHLRGVDSVPNQVNEASPVLLAVHRALDERRFCRWLAEQRVTHLVFDATSTRTYRPIFVDGYSAADYQDDVRRLGAFLTSSARMQARAAEASLWELLPADQCREPG
jgi:hypothetical protein